jgi:hypothetical protein
MRKPGDCYIGMSVLLLHSALRKIIKSIPQVGTVYVVMMAWLYTCKLHCSWTHYSCLTDMIYAKFVCPVVQVSRLMILGSRLA